MKKAGLPYVALLLSLVGALVLAAAGGAAEAKPIKAAWIYVGPHNDGGWSRGTRRRPALRPEDAGQEGHHDLQGERPRGPADRPGDRRARARRQQDHLRHVVRVHGRDGGSGEEVPRRVLRARHRLQVRARTSRTTSAPSRTRSTSPAWRRAPRRRTATSGSSCRSRSPRSSGTRTASRSGVLAVRPDAKIRLVWTKSWFDPAKERKAAESLVAAGVDVIGQNVDSPSAGQYAQSKGIPWVGHGSNAKRFAPTSWLTSGLYDWGLYYLKRVKAAQNGTWKTGSYWGSMADGFAVLAPFGPKVSPKTRAADQREEEGDHLRQVLRVHRPAVRPGGQAPRAEGQADDAPRDPHGDLARQGRHREPEGLGEPPSGFRSMDARTPGTHGRPERGGRGDARDHEAVPGHRRERRRDVRGRAGRGPRAPRGERRREDDVDERPHRPLPAGRGRDRGRRPARRAALAARRDRRGDRDGAPALPARRDADGGGQPRPLHAQRALRAPSARGRPTGRADRGGAPHAGRPGCAHLAALDRRAAAGGDHEGRPERLAGPHPRRADGRPHAPGGRRGCSGPSG